MHEKDEERRNSAISNDEKNFVEPFEVITPTIEGNNQISGEVDVNPEQSQGLYGWISSWFGCDKSNGKNTVY